ncbi:ATP-binding protein [Pedobacter jeongneungensis]|uniref:ATP-binding protein n=1 Tax=Pedobacter jeongneungensis TaxID=947309 RepID=UPI000469B021|nr:ATP-binding protein [Pedobacter jeongneungensis]
MERDLHYSAIVVGRKGVGKSTFLAKTASQYPTESKVLIIDVNGSPAYNSFKTIEPNQVKLFRRGHAKLLGTPTDETLEIIAKDFNGGLIVFEDATKYISGNVRPSIKAFLVDHRMYQCDLIFAFHSLKRVPPFFWEMISFCTLFKTAEVFDKTFKNRIPNYENIKKAYDKVAASKDIRYNLTIETLV